MADKIERYYAVVALRVSSEKQGLMGDSPQDQEIQIKRRIQQVEASLSCKIEVKKTFLFTESAARELDVQPIQKAIEFCKDPQNKIKYFFIKSIDRFTRGGSTTYGLLKAQVIRYGVQLVDCYGIIGSQQINTLGHLGIEYSWSKFSPSFITEMLEAERARMEHRDILTRLIGSEINYVRMGFRVRQAPPGYENIKIDTEHGRRCILQAHPIETPWFIRMYDLRAQGNLSDPEIVDDVNSLGYKSRRRRCHDHNDTKNIIGHIGEKKLTVKQMQKYIKNPIYCGINTEKWTNGKPIKERFTGLVTIDLWNKANRGKITIIENSDGTVSIYKGTPLTASQKRQRDNPNFPYRKHVLCPKCRKPFMGSFSRSESGYRHGYYHCRRGHEYICIPVDDFHKTIEFFVDEIKFCDQYFPKFRQLVLKEWEKREKQISTDTINYAQRIIEIDREVIFLKEKIKTLESPTAIRLFEADI